MKINSLSKVALAVVLGVSLPVVAGSASNSDVTRAAVLKSNADIAYAAYSDSLTTAKALKQALTAFVAAPTEQSLATAKQAWIDSREPYGQTEVYRFRVGPIDALKADGSLGEEGAGPEGNINAWPLGEGIIDYVSTSPKVDGDAFGENGRALSSNIIANSKDYATINKATILELNGKGEDERNVTTGYHAIEFLLWGQDLNQNSSSNQLKHDNTPGQRPVSDYFSAANGNAKACTSGAKVSVADATCDRRGDYLLAVTDILIDDLTPVVNAWAPTGSHYKNFVAGGDASLAKILESMGRLSFGELAGERINIALTTDSQEDEHSCFSDNTHRDIFLNSQGVQNSYNATYTRINGEKIHGTSVHDLLVANKQQALANKLRGSLAATMKAAAVIDAKAKAGIPFDVLIQEGVAQQDVMAVIKNLVAQTDDIENVIKALGVTTNSLRDDTEEKI